ncbi:TMEM183A family protein [Megaselia abdita]
MTRKHKKKDVIENSALTLKDFADAKGSIGLHAKKSTHRQDLKLIDNDIEALPDEDDFVEGRTRSRKAKEDPNHIYSDIDMTVWFLVGDYIRPEDVKSFALICKNTENVVSHASFWKSLYRRYLNKDSSSEKLRLSCFRSNVIKSLYKTYPPFVERLKRPTTTMSLEALKSLLFVNCYYKEESKVWIYCYKFWNRIKARKPRILRREEVSEEDYELENMIAKFNNIFENPHEGFTLLLVFTNRFIPMPVECTSAVGQEFKVFGIRQILSTDMRSNHLEIELSRARENSRAVTIKYPSIIKFKLINWWNPDYNIFS